MKVPEIPDTHLQTILSIIELGLSTNPEERELQIKLAQSPSEEVRLREGVKAIQMAHEALFLFANGKLASEQPAYYGYLQSILHVIENYCATIVACLQEPNGTDNLPELMKTLEETVQMECLKGAVVLYLCLARELELGIPARS